MNMHTPPPSLDALKAQRERIRKRLEPIAQSRAALAADTEALEISKRELADFEAAEADATAKWVAGGRKSARPAPDLDRHSQLTQRVAAATRVVENGKTALQDLSNREEQVNDELDELDRQIEQRAVDEVAADAAKRVARWAENDAENAQIIPELCDLLGFLETVRADRRTKVEALGLGLVANPHRLRWCGALFTALITQ